MGGLTVVIGLLSDILTPVGISVTAVIHCLHD